MQGFREAVRLVGLASTATYLLILGVALEYAVLFYNYGDYLMQHGEPFLIVALALFCVWEFLNVASRS